jgi:cyclopropane fatty-acyl-phospholipid synthase-like methyltransferase
MLMQTNVPEDFARVAELYDHEMSENNLIHDLIYPIVYGEAEYIGQFSDNSASEISHMARAMQLTHGAQVLEIGCGTAPVACFLAQTFGWQVVGIDIASAPLEKARARIQSTNLAEQVQVVQGDIYSSPFGRPFEGAYLTGALCHFDALSLFGRCHDLLQPGGVLAFMERVRLTDLDADEWRELTLEWACPHVYSIDEYVELLNRAGFSARTVTDLTPTFREWQQRSVTVREMLSERITSLTSREYYEISLRLAAYENSATQARKLGYVLIVAEATDL